VRSQPILKILNLSIAVLLILLLVSAYWFAWRPLPSISGQLRAPVKSPATIDRDRYGVPHIMAADWEDAIFLQGYVTAQDRMWQMDALRRFAAGELSEVVGRATLESDQESRHLRMRRMAEEAARNLPPADYAVAAAYARGVNYYLETNRGHYGLEFALLGYDPRPWTIVDSVLTGLQMFRNLTTTWRDELQKLTLESAPGADRAKVDQLFPAWSGHELQPGSNAWAISGAWTASGRPILANDPHLDFSIPSVWYQIHLHAPGLNVIGVSLPGAPCVIIGHNERIAWGVTNLGFDVQDLYREQLNPQNGRYSYRGSVEQAKLETDAVAVKGEKPVQTLTWVTRHGPIIANQGGAFYALRWTAAEPGYQIPFMDIDRAGNWQEFLAALSRFPGPGQNFVYADVDGNIGYHATGKLPIRRSYDGDLPVDGSTGEFEWEGFIPFDELPSFYNPPDGSIVTANQNPFPHNYQYRVHGEFSPQYRSSQIRDMLRARKGWKPQEMVAVQKDVYSPFDRYLASDLVAAYGRARSPNPALKDAVDLLKDWNGQMDKDSPAAMVVSMVYAELRKTIGLRAAPAKGADYTYEMSPAVVENLLRARPKDWFADWDSVIMKAFADGIDRGTKLQGSNVKGWRWGRYNEVAVNNPVSGNLPVVGRYFNIGPFWMSGASTTPKQTTRALGPSMRFVGDPSNWEQSINYITVGQSGHVLSTHYKDQWDTYYYAGSIPMQFGRVESKGTVTVTPRR
jgi:penicillin amidase